MKRQCTWAELAQQLSLHASMIYQVMAGKKTLSDKSLYRLLAAEREAGIPMPEENGSPGFQRLEVREPRQAYGSPDVGSTRADDLRTLERMEKALACLTREVESMRARLSAPEEKPNK